MFDYKIGIHFYDGSYEESDIKTGAPVSKGDAVSLEHGGDEYEVFSVTHCGDSDSVIHCKELHNH